MDGPDPFWRALGSPVRLRMGTAGGADGQDRVNAVNYWIWYAYVCHYVRYIVVWNGETGAGNQIRIGASIMNIYRYGEVPFPPHQPSCSTSYHSQLGYNVLSCSRCSARRLGLCLPYPCPKAILGRHDPIIPHGHMPHPPRRSPDHRWILAPCGRLLHRHNVGH